MTNPILQTTSLSYNYARGVKTLHEIDMVVEKESIYGFLGPNGSGKTTTLSLLLGLLNNQQGRIEIFGQELSSNRTAILKRIGSLIETPSLYGHLTAMENLEIYRGIYGATRERAREVLNMVGLDNTGKKTAKKFSLGMKQRLAIALALLPSPELLILDEPSNGLDPAGIIELRRLILHLNKNFGMTILISSHLLAEVEKMVSHIGIIYEGRMLFQGTPASLHHVLQKGSRLIIHTSDNPKAMQILHDHSPEENGKTISLSFAGEKQVAMINKLLCDNNVDVYLLHPHENDLEDLFIHLTSAQS